MKMVKVTRIPLISRSSYLDGTEIPYRDVCKILWTLQNETRVIKNRSVQIAWEYFNFSQEYKDKNGCYPKDKDILGTDLVSHTYHRLKGSYAMGMNMFQTTIRETITSFKNHSGEMLKGLRSIDEYKSNQPLEIKAQSLKIDYVNGKFVIKIGMLNKEWAKENNLPTQFVFEANLPPRAKSAITILERCCDKVYGISGSKLLYDKKWFLNLAYNFENDNYIQLDKNKILGVDLGVAKPIMASVYGDKDRFFVDGGEVEHVRKTVEARRNSMLRQGKWCGEGRIGHGYYTRVKPLENVSDKIYRCRDTINHKYSKHLIDYAVANGCGTIQMENLKGIADTADRFLKSWSYFDLQTKIEYKAKEKGIKVVYIEPKYTSKRCSKCGYIHKDNRTEQARFKCLSCGFEENADYNASQNIAIRDIDKIISTDMKLT